MAFNHDTVESCKTDLMRESINRGEGDQSNMRAREFIREFTINVPVTVNIPLNDLVNSQTQSTDVLNPGVRYGDDQSAKWSPPLQQHLDTVKDGVGMTMSDVTSEPSEEELASALANQPQAGAPISKRKKLMPLFVSSPSQPG
jgi:hypothetical protein